MLAREDVPGEKRLWLSGDASGSRGDDGCPGQHLQQTLPDYMIPAAYVLLDGFPDDEWKIDRERCQRRWRVGRVVGAYVARATRWSGIGTFGQVLGVAQVGVHDNFFDLGGSSVLT
ncbi:MAG: hypothetical protein H6660_10670 [Ardenticatenaceae bacterium]|nr:hypothetical protein [Ardenticatenaceae bacterium]